MLTMKDIIRDGHPTLREKAADVPVPLTDEDKKLADDMLEFLKNSQDEKIAAQYKLRSGVGLAAPQLNVQKKIIVIHFFDDEKEDYVTYQLFNPKIISHSVEKAYLPQGEGCLSVDENIPGLVHRNARITVKAIDQHGKEIKLRLKSFTAIVVQHEIDHLNGVMFYDYIDQNEPFKVQPNAIEVK